jgi:IS5 family transposase
VDVKIIATPSSSKDASASRDPRMQQTRKGRNWNFGMKLHVVTDQSGIVHTVRVTAAGVADINQLPHCYADRNERYSAMKAYCKEYD